MIVIIDVTKLDSPLRKQLDRYDWWERVSRLGQVILWRPETNESNLPSAESWNDIMHFASGQGADQAVLVSADQIFLDVEVAESGLQAAGSGWDYFTQYEHCRLPVGAGIRAVSLSHPDIATWEGDPISLVRHIQENPTTFSCLYDNTIYVNFEHALLDCRWSPDDQLHQVGLPEGQPLKSFLAVSSKASTYVPERSARFIDERLMPAAYGFESPECAKFPTYVMFDITNVCNSRCVHCPHSTVFADNKPEPKYLDPAIYRNAIDECADHQIQFIRITADGEPLLHPHLVDMLNYANKKNVGPVGLTSNGSLMDSELARQVIDSGIFMVDFSLDASTKDTFAQIRRGLPFDKVMRNVENFIQLARERRPEMKVMVSFVKQEANKNEEQDFRKRWEPLTDKVLIRELISNVNLVDTGKQRDASGGQRWPCPHFFRRVVINYDGMIKACPVDWENTTIYRSLSEISLFKTWHSDFYHKSRLEHLNNSFVSQQGCASCSDWQGSPWGLGYEKVIFALK